MPRQFTQSDLEAYLDEALDPAETVEIEAALRDSPQLAEQLVTIHSRRDAGVHTLGEIWRRHRVSCPTRQQLGNFLLEALDAEQAAAVRFHIDQVGCRFCAANLQDLRAQQAEASQEVSGRQRKYFQTSAGYLHRKD